MYRRYCLSILALSASVVHAKCPNGTVEGADRYDCYLFKLNPATWYDAEIDCNSRGGHLASVSSEAANIVVSKQAGFNCARQFWVGGWFTSDAPGLWSWTDGSRFSSFAAWALGHPVLRAGYCAAVNVTDGRWHSRFCSEKKPYVCQLSSAPKNDRPIEAKRAQDTPQNPIEVFKANVRSKVVPDGVPEPTRCPPEWTYVAVITVRDFWINQRARCSEFGGDLVSIHSNESNYATVEFAREAAGVADNVCHGFAIGFFRSFWVNLHMWSVFWWTDGSPFDDYANWDPRFPHGAPTDGSNARMTVCGLQRDDDGYGIKNGYWDGRDDPAVMAICQMSA